MQWPPIIIISLLYALVPLIAIGFAGSRIVSRVERLPVSVRFLLPALFGIPYVLVATWAGTLRTTWCLTYFALPITVAVLLRHAREADPEQRGDWRDFSVLFILGLAVDLRWLEPAWPVHLSVISKLMLLDSGLYGFVVIRRLSDGLPDLRIRLSDARIGLREVLFYTPIAATLGLALGFLHLHPAVPKLSSACLAFLFTLFFIAIPEEIYFRGWMQNLLQRRLGRVASLIVTSILFGLAHFNKRSAHFNWRYVLLATIAGIFYGRAWSSERRIAASSITHATVDTVWSLWFI